MRRTPGRLWRAGVLVIIGTALSCFALSAHAAGPNLAEVLARIHWDTKAYPTPMGFEQQIVVRSLIKTWQFTSDVERRGGALSVEMHGAPSFIPPEVTTALIEPDVILNDFDLTLVGERMEGSARYYIIEGRRRPGIEAGAASGRIWVDPRSWLIDRIEARYWWGYLDVRQTYRKEQGLTVLDRQRATISPFGLRLDIAYTRYWFGGET